ncbi:MAG: response regulator [Desulfobulbaceae bacterium]|nr:MAG: response regulator [Desulfobulbaceae bacterium]
MLKGTYSFRTLYQIVIATVLLLAVGTLGIFWLVGEYRHHDQMLDLVRDDYISTRKAESRTLVNLMVESADLRRLAVEPELRKRVSEAVDNGYRIAASIHKEMAGRFPDKEIQQVIIRALMAERPLDGHGYFWIHDTGYRLIAHPYRSESIGKSDFDLTDSQGQKIAQSFVRTAISQPEGGFVNYYWSRPEIDERYHIDRGQLKIGYVKHFAPYEWVIGAGDFVADADNKAREAAIRRIAAVSYGTKGYVFIHTKEGICLNHANKEVIGKNRWELLDASGMKLVQELDRTGRQPGGGFLEYTATFDPESGKPARKISYVQAIPGWEWVIGSGVYLDDIDEKITEYRHSLLDELRRKIITTLCILVSILIAVFFIGRHLFLKLLNEMSLFTMAPAAGRTGPIDTKRLKIRELKILAEQANRILKEKEEAQAELAKAKRMESIGQMAGGVAHDLNNLLSGIINYPELLLLKLPMDSPLRDPLEKIRESGNRAAAVVADLLTVARGVASNREVLDLNETVREYLQSPQHGKLMNSPPEISCRIMLHDEPLPISCSPIHVTKCIVNLITNAAEALDKGGTITIATSAVQVDGIPAQLSPGPYALLEISDNGKGIPAEALPHIFDPFFTRKKLGRSGTGLGLTVVWNTMLDHQGTVTVASTARGSCFSLYFPITEEQATPRTLMVDSAELRGEGSILVVDDEEIQRDIASTILTVLGYSVETAASGEEAVEFLRRRKFDLVILDMIMPPGMNGRQTYEMMITVHPGQKAIIVSGFSENEEVQVACRLGAGTFVKKPYSLNQLGLAVKKELEKDRG